MHFVNQPLIKMELTIIIYILMWHQAHTNKKRRKKRTFKLNKVWPSRMHFSETEKLALLKRYIDSLLGPIIIYVHTLRVLHTLHNRYQTLHSMHYSLIQHCTANCTGHMWRRNVRAQMCGWKHRRVGRAVSKRCHSCVPRGGLEGGQLGGRWGPWDLSHFTILPMCVGIFITVMSW